MFEIVADNKKREVHFQFPPRKMLRSSSQAAVVRKSIDCRHGRSRGRVPIGGGIHARVTDIEVRILAPECCRMREHDIRGVNAGADDHQLPELFAAGGHGGHEAVHCALSRLGGAVSHTMDRTAMDIFMGYVGWHSATVAHTDR